MSNYIIQSENPKTSIQLKPSDGQSIRNAVEKRLEVSITQYADMIGIQIPNLSSYLNGHKPITKPTLDQILNGLGLESKWELQITILPITIKIQGSEQLPSVEATSTGISVKTAPVTPPETPPFQDQQV